MGEVEPTSGEECIGKAGQDTEEMASWTGYLRRALKSPWGFTTTRGVGVGVGQSASKGQEVRNNAFGADVVSVQMDGD